MLVKSSCHILVAYKTLQKKLKILKCCPFLNNKPVKTYLSSYLILILYYHHFWPKVRTYKCLESSKFTILYKEVKLIFFFFILVFSSNLQFYNILALFLQPTIETYAFLFMYLSYYIYLDDATKTNSMASMIIYYKLVNVNYLLFIF